MSEIDERLEAIRERAAAATKGEWHRQDVDYGESYEEPEVWVDTHILAALYAIKPQYLEGGRFTAPETVAQMQADADFIAAAREDVPWLVARLDQTRALAGRLRDALAAAAPAVGGYAGDEIRALVAEADAVLGPAAPEAAGEVT